MTEPGSEPIASGARERFSQYVAETQTRFDRIAQLRTKAETISATATSPDGSVTITVNANGAITDLRVTDRLSGQPGARIAEQVLATMRGAQARIADKVREVMRETIGDDKEIADEVMSAYHHEFPEPQTPARPEAVDEMRLATPAPEPTPAPVRPPAPMTVPRRVRQTRPQDAEWENPDEEIMKDI